MNKLEKLLKKDLDGNKDAMDSIVDNYASTLKVFKSTAENDITTANLNIQKALTNVTTADAEDIINEIYRNLVDIDDATDRIEKIDQITEIMFEEVQERTKVVGLKKK